MLMSTHVMNKGETLVLMAHVGVGALLSSSSPRSRSGLFSSSLLSPAS